MVDGNHALALSIVAPHLMSSLLGVAVQMIAFLTAGSRKTWIDWPVSIPSAVEVSILSPTLFRRGAFKIRLPFFFSIRQCEYEYMHVYTHMLTLIDGWIPWQSGPEWVGHDDSICHRALSLFLASVMSTPCYFSFPGFCFWASLVWGREDKI